jgi:GxxExxY protein
MGYLRVMKRKKDKYLSWGEEIECFRSNRKFPKNEKMEENQISYQIIGRALEIHRKLGPGLLESAYEKILAYELRKIGMSIESQVLKPLKWESIEIEKAYRIDLIVENKVIVELKCLDEVNPVHFSQVLTYLKLSNLKLGLIINFKTKVLRDGIYRVVNGLDDRVL